MENTNVLKNFIPTQLPSNIRLYFTRIAPYVKRNFMPFVSALQAIFYRNLATGSSWNDSRQIVERQLGDINDHRMVSRQSSSVSALQVWKSMASSGMIFFLPLQLWEINYRTVNCHTGLPWTGQDHPGHSGSRCLSLYQQTVRRNYRRWRRQQGQHSWCGRFDWSGSSQWMFARCDQERTSR